MPSNTFSRLRGRPRSPSICISIPPPPPPPPWPPPTITVHVVIPNAPPSPLTDVDQWFTPERLPDQWVWHKWHSFNGHEIIFTFTLVPETQIAELQLHDNHPFTGWSVTKFGIPILWGAPQTYLFDAWDSISPTGLSVTCAFTF